MPPRDSRTAQRKVTIKDVAARAGVSLSAASYALSGRGGKGPSGSPETRALVESAARELGYVPNKFARAMRLGHSDSIVLALGTVADPWGIALTQAVRTQAQEHGQSTVLLADESWYEFLANYPSDCAFITSVDWDPNAPRKLLQLAKSGLRIVAFSEKLEATGFDVVSSPSASAIQDAYRRLRRRHDTVSFMSRGSASARRSPLARHAIFTRAAHEAEDPQSGQSVFFAGRSMQEAHEHSHEILSRSDRPTAIIASTAYLALALHSIASNLGIRVPEDLEIISIGDVPPAFSSLSPISYYGVRDVFDRLASIIVSRAIQPESTEFSRHVLHWEYFPGATTQDPWDPSDTSHIPVPRFDI